MIKRTMIPIAKADECTSNRRIVIWRDRHVGGRAAQGDHLFIRWGRHPRYNFSDSIAECPFIDEVDDNGEETGRKVAKKGLIVFAINLYDHSGLRFSLGGDPSGGGDPGGWDTTKGAAFLYVDKERFVSYQGEGRWMQVPTDKDWAAPWRPAKDMDEFRELTLRPLAQGEVDEMNLIEEGQCYGFSEEFGIGWTKTYVDGRVETGIDWVEGPNSGCGGFLTEHADDIEFPRDPSVPVYYQPDVYLCADEDNGLGPFEYTIPEFVIRKDAPGPSSPDHRHYLYYAGTKGDEHQWVTDIDGAKTYNTWCSATATALAVLGDFARTHEAFVEKDGWCLKKQG